MDVFKFELVRTFFLYQKVKALRKKDTLEIVDAIKALDEKRTRAVLVDRFNTFKKKLLKQAIGDEIGAKYLAEQIEQQLTNFCRQISLFEGME